MTNRDLAQAFLNRYCAADVDGMAALLSPDLQFIGPLHRFHNADEYLASLHADPPEQSTYNILSVTEDDDSVAIFYLYEKDPKPLTIAQWFEMKDQRIRKILLVFDTSALI